MRQSFWLLTVGFLLVSDLATVSAQADRATAAQAYGKQFPVVQQQTDGLYVCEAEEFQVQAGGAQPGWKAGNFGENYYAATFANSFLSRKAFLGAPAELDADTIAERQVNIKAAGKFLVLLRYEAAYRFETQFRVEIAQGGKTVFRRNYGARNNLKIWAFRQKLKTEVGWSWGAVENVVWEGHNAFANLKPGRATIRLIAGKQPGPPAKRNIDLVMLTTDVEQVNMRIEKENYLPLDGMLTQSGDVYLKVTNLGKGRLKFTGGRAQSGGNWQQHSPYWVHIRNWKPPVIELAPGKSSEWVEVGGTMDTLNDGQWRWTGNEKYRAEFALKTPDGKFTPLKTFTNNSADNGDIELAGDADTRYSKRLRKTEDVLYDLLAYLKKENPSPHGRTPKLTPIFGYTFAPQDEGRHAKAVDEFVNLFGLSSREPSANAARGYLDVRSVATPKLEQYCKDFKGDPKKIEVISLGDEIGLPSPSGATANEGFRNWLKSQKVVPKDLDPAAGNDWMKIAYNITPATKTAKPGLYYWSKRYQYHFGIQAIKERTDILRRYFPNAGVGANFSPHYPQEHMYLGEVFKWVTVFREGGMTQPWGEDYIWQVPVVSAQVNNINLDLFRAGLRHKPNGRIHYYVMPHMPNNTPSQWRRLFYGALSHGMKTVNLFEFRPVQVAYTENHVDEPEMYRMVLGSFREMGLFEDIIQNGQVESGSVGLWFSQTGDIWGDTNGSFAAGKRALYTAIRQQQLPLDILIEQDAIDGTLNKYKTLYLTDAHVSTAASEKIAAWVNAGGTLFTTAGAGMFNELNQPNKILRALQGVEQTGILAPENQQLIWIKQGLPFLDPMDVASFTKLAAEEFELPPTPAKTVPVFAVRSQLKNVNAKIYATFRDGSPAITWRSVGKGAVHHCAFLPGLSYYKPAIPKIPVDRGATDDAMVHLLPTNVDPLAALWIRAAAANNKLPVDCSEPFVETTIIRAPQGVVIPLVNWSGKPQQEFTVNVSVNVPLGKISLASGKPVKQIKSETGRTFQFDLDVADALIFRP